MIRYKLFENTSTSDPDYSGEVTRIVLTRFFLLFKGVMSKKERLSSFVEISLWSTRSYGMKIDKGYILRSTGSLTYIACNSRWMRWLLKCTRNRLFQAQMTEMCSYDIHPSTVIKDSKLCISKFFHDKGLI